MLYSLTSSSRIILALLTTGEAYLCDTRKETKSRTQLKEVVEEEREDASRRYA